MVVLWMHQHAPTKAAASWVSGYAIGVADSGSSADIARSIQAWDHLMYEIRLV